MLNIKQIKSTWNFDKYHTNFKDKDILQNVKNELQNAKELAKKYKNKQYLKSNKLLFTALEDFENFSESNAKAVQSCYYIYLSQCLDQNNAELKALMNKIKEFEYKIQDQIRFFDLSLTKIKPTQQKQILSDNTLTKYHKYLKDIFEETKHTLSNKEEKLIERFTSTSYSNWSDLTIDLINQEEITTINENNEQVTVPFNGVSKYTKSLNKQVRDTAFANIETVYTKYEAIAEKEYNSLMEYKKNITEIRKYKNAYDSRFKNEELEPETIFNLNKALEENLNICHKYFNLKAKLFNTKQLDWSDVSAPLYKIQTKLTWETSAQMVYDSLSNLDPEFVKIYEQMLYNGNIDVFPKAGKSGGAFCTFKPIKSFPSYILLNHNDNITDVTTLAHEMGHAIHTEYMFNNQSPTYANCSFALAEIASTFIENNLVYELLKTLTKQEKISLLMSVIEDDILSTFAQAVRFEFEKDLHEKFRTQGYVSAKEINSMYKNHLTKIYGPSVNTNFSAEKRWIIIGHLRTFFYNYQYSMGLLISKGFQNLITQDKNNLSLFKKFMASGSSKAPVELFLDLGIDLNSKDFWLKGIKEIEQNINQLELLVNE